MWATVLQGGQLHPFIPRTPGFRGEHRKKKDKRLMENAWVTQEMRLFQRRSR
jgi:hypothetical protein